MSTIVNELKNAYLATFEMFRLAITNCPEPSWAKVYGDNSPFWKEAYHCVFWLHNFVGDSAKQFSDRPFSRRIDSRLSSPPTERCSREELMGFIAETERYATETLARLRDEDLLSPDSYCDGPEPRFENVLQRLLYGLRHGQHHVGKLTGYLFCSGIDYDPWR